MTALFAQAQARDYVDVNGALQRYSREDLLRLAEEHDPGFDRILFGQALAAIDRLPESEFLTYGLEPAAIAELRQVLAGWARELSG